MAFCCGKPRGEDVDVANALSIRWPKGLTAAEVPQAVRYAVGKAQHFRSHMPGEVRFQEVVSILDLFLTEALSAEEKALIGFGTAQGEALIAAMVNMTCHAAKNGKKNTSGV